MSRLSPPIRFASHMALACCCAAVGFAHAQSVQEPLNPPESYQLACLAGNPNINDEVALEALATRLEALAEVEVHVLILLDPLSGTDAATREALKQLLNAYPFTVHIFDDHTAKLPAPERYGEDAFLFLDDRNSLGGEVLDNRDGALHQQRRAIKAARWSIGFAPALSPALPMRHQLSLMVDDPLDYLIAGEVRGMVLPEGSFGPLPWGATLFGHASTLENTDPLLYHVTPRHIAPVTLHTLQELQEARQAAEATEAAEAVETAAEEVEVEAEATAE